MSVSRAHFVALRATAGSLCRGDSKINIKKKTIKGAHNEVLLCPVGFYYPSRIFFICPELLG